MSLEQPSPDNSQSYTGVSDTATVRIKIAGVGGAGTNALDRLKLDDLTQVHLAVVNTDLKTHSSSPVAEKLLIGRSLTRGLSTGGEMELGRQAAESDREMLKRLVNGVDLLFLLAGLGGGTSSGAAPLLAQLAVEAGATVIAMVTLPFSREGQRRSRQAEEALGQLRANCHAVISLPNDLLMQQIDEKATVLDAFAVADDWMARGIRAICSMLFNPGLINVDFANLRAALSAVGGKTIFGFAEARGPECVKQALRDLELCPLLHLPENKYIRRVDRLIVNIVGGPDLGMAMVNEILDQVTEKFGSKENTTLGAVIDDSIKETVRLCIIGKTGAEGSAKPKPAANHRQPAASIPSNMPRDFDPFTQKQPSAGGSRAAQHRSEQEEFDFMDRNAQLGCFDKSGENFYEKDNLDIPTFIRKGIKISLS